MIRKLFPPYTHGGEGCCQSRFRYESYKMIDQIIKLVHLTKQRKVLSIYAITWGTTKNLIVDSHRKVTTDAARISRSILEVLKYEVAQLIREPAL